jgi:hypothetical protein
LEKAVTNGINMLDIFPGNPFHFASSLIQTSCTVSSVTTAYTGRILFGKTSPTNSLNAKNVFDGAQRRLVTPIEKKEPITPDMLLKLYDSVFKDLPLQNFCVFPSYYELRGAILFSNLIMCRFLFLKVKLTYIATEIELSYPEWIATCIQLKILEKYLLLLNRNLTKCKDRFEIRKENRPL